MERPAMERAMSTDLVMDLVLSNLKARDLLNCRKVSMFWNKAASSVLRKRSTMVKKIYDEKDLLELQECMEKSVDFPLSGLKLSQPWRLRSPVPMEFFMKYGARFTSLHLGTSSKTKLQDLAPIINHFPRLSVLEVGRADGNPPRVKLLDSAAGHEDGGVLNLPLVRTFRMCAELNEDVLRQVFTSASPSLRIECLGATYGMLKALKRVGKLQAVSVMIVDGHEFQKDCASRMDKLMSTESPALTKLELNIDGFLSWKGLKKILISSQHTLKELRMYGPCPSEFLPKCPVLAKLTKLRLRPDDYPADVFEGSHGDKFPALKELELDLINKNEETFCLNLSDGLFIVPSLTTIHLVGYVEKDKIEQLAKSFPNVTEIRLSYYYYDNNEWEWETDPFDIWSVGAFKFLEKLVISDYAVERPTKNFINIDSFLTGIPTVICEKLRKHKQLNLSDCPFSQFLRGDPSILQLEELKELIICMTPHFTLKELPEEPPLISMVSVWYALQMMPDLHVKLVHECSFSSHDEERNKAALLEAGFKQVQDYIKLEPFYY